MVIKNPDPTWPMPTAPMDDDDNERKYKSAPDFMMPQWGSPIPSHFKVGQRVTDVAYGSRRVGTVKNLIDPLGCGMLKVKWETEDGKPCVRNYVGTWWHEVFKIVEKN